jgi:uncharacterized cupredoxin-like copper-binding protein
MKILKNTFARSLVAALMLAAMLVAGNDAFAQGGMMQEKKVDKRKLTTIQTASVDVGEMKNAVEVRYLNLPWGRTTFGYIENGSDSANKNYYATRNWPVAHLRLATAAKYQGKTLTPGDYAMIISPKNPETKSGMKLAFASFKPAEANGTFLVPGNVFVEAPKDATVIADKEVAFAQGAPLVDQLMIMTGKEGKTVSITIHYGDRTLTEKLTLQ